MTELEDFDRALLENSLTDGDAWGDDGIVLVSAIAARLGEADLRKLRLMWRARPPLWQQHCAEALGANRLDESIEFLLNMVDDGRPRIGLAALESLSEFDPARFSPAQLAHILDALDARLGQPVELLHRVLLEGFAARLHRSKAVGR